MICVVDTEMNIATTIKEETPICQNGEYSGVVFKRPADILTDTPNKRPRLLIEEEGRPTREISSVMMTTSGFLSPAREGKLPESRTPTSSQEQIAAASMQPNYTTAPSNIIPRGFEKKKINKEVKKVDKRKERNSSKELFKPISLIKKIPPKEIKKTGKANQNIPPPPEVLEKPQITVAKTPKTVAKKGPKQHKEKTQLPAVTIEKIPLQPVEVKIVDGKLTTEPDKNKLNFFKKISKVKEDKMDKVEKKMKEEIRPETSQSRESSPDLIIDESDHKTWDHSRNNFPPADIIKEKTKEKPQQDIKIYDTVKNSPRSEKDFAYDDNMSPPGTPLTPKTPEMPTHSPPTREKRKKKEKNKSASKKMKLSKKSETEVVELDRPKTPDPINLVKNDPPPIIPPQFINHPHFFPAFPSGPGLIPAPFSNPLLPRLPVNFKHGFGQPAHIPAMSNLAPFVPVKIPEEPPALAQPPTPENKEKEETVVQVKEKHKKDKKDKLKKKSKKDKVKNKSEKKKLKEEKKEKDKIKKTKKDKKKEKEVSEFHASV